LGGKKENLGGGEANPRCQQALQGLRGSGSFERFLEIFVKAFRVPEFTLDIQRIAKLKGVVVNVLVAQRALLHGFHLQSVKFWAQLGLH